MALSALRCFTLPYAPQTWQIVMAVIMLMLLVLSHGPQSNWLVPNSSTPHISAQLTHSRSTPLASDGSKSRYELQAPGSRPSNLSVSAVTKFSIRSASICAAWELPHLHADAITYHLGNVRNAALAGFANGPLVIATSDSVKIRKTQSLRNRQHFACTSEHRVNLFSLTCDVQQGKLRLLGRLPSLEPHRVCQDVLNFRGRGPEDPRILPLPYDDLAPTGEKRALIVVSDYVPAASDGEGALTYNRLMVAYVLTISDNGRATFGPPKVLGGWHSARSFARGLLSSRLHRSR